MAKKYLSGEELLQQIRRHPELPQRGGFKEYEPDGSWLQNKRLQAFNEERRDVLVEERVQKISSLSVAEWDEERCKALVKKSGKFWKNMGHVEDGKQWLYPEEALFLVDEGVMEVYRGGLPLSMEDAYSVLLRSDVPLENYQAFAHLCRLGYIVRRHVNKITRYEKLIGLDKLVLNEGKCTKGRKRQFSVEDSLSSTVAKKMSKSVDTDADGSQAERGDEHETSNETLPLQVEASCENRSKILDAQELPGNEIIKDVDQTAERPLLSTEEGTCMDTKQAASFGNNYFSMAEDVRCGSHDATTSSSGEVCNFDADMRVCERKCKTGQYLRNDGLDCSSSAMKIGVHRYSTWDFDSIKFPNMATETSTEMILESLPEHLLPPGVKLSNSKYIIDIKHYRRPSKISVANSRKTVLQVTTVRPKAKNWAEYKRLLRSESEAQSLASSPAGILWTGDVTPLIKPWQATSTCAVLSKLKVFENFDPFDLKERIEWGELGKDQQPQIIYDVFLPDAKFRKSDPGVPAMCLCVCRQENWMPSFAAICQVVRQCPSAATLMWAVVDCGDVAFYSFNSVNLPREFSFP